MVSRLLIVAVFALGCAGAQSERSYIVSSESSYYSPVVRLAIAVDTTVDSVIVAIDSGTIRAHGIAESPGAVMRDLTMEAIIARAPQKAHSGNRPVEPWIPVAASPSVRLIDSLVFNMEVPLTPLRLAVPRPLAAQLRDLWLVFRIRGNAVTHEIRIADGQVVPASVQRGAVRVYACGQRNLSGSLDRARAKRLAREYATVC